MGNDDFCSMSEVDKELSTITERPNSSAIRRKVNRLYATGFLDIYIPKGKDTRYWRRKFRIKDKYVKRNNKTIS